jgi:siroheme synthase (precorrin-2 oxidase/ferrochelatase)
LWADRHRFLLCTIDQPAYGFVAMQAIVAAGPARIAISTGGVSPRVGGILRAALQDALDSRFVRFLTALAERRRTSRAANPGDAAVQLKYPAWFTTESKS